MGTSAFQTGAMVEIVHKPYRLLRMVDDQLWQLEDLRTKRICEYTAPQLRQLYTCGELIFSS